MASDVIRGQNTPDETENEWQKTEQVPILLLSVFLKWTDFSSPSLKIASKASQARPNPIGNPIKGVYFLYPT